MPDKNSSESRPGLFGEILETNFQFQHNLSQSRHSPTLKLESLVSSKATHATPNATKVFESEQKFGTQPALEFFKLSNSVKMRYHGVGDFDLHKNKITASLLPDANPALVEVKIIGKVISLWLEIQKHICLHAASIRIGNRAFLLTGLNGAGKSTLSAALLARGFTLLSDDIVPLKLNKDSQSGVSCFARPGYPQMRMWPDLCHHFAGDPNNFENVLEEDDKKRVPIGDTGFGNFDNKSYKTGCIYVLDRGASQTTRINTLTSAESAIELARNSFSATLTSVLGLDAERLNRIASITEHVPARRVAYASDINRVDESIDNILKDISRLGYSTKA